MRRVGLFAAVAGAAAVLLTGCGGNAETERPLAEEEVQLLSNVLWRNHSAGGMEFVLTSRAGGSGGTVTIAGAWSFTDQVGCARVEGGAPPHPVTETCWGGDTVLERRPTLDAVLAEAGQPGARFVARPADVTARRLDVLLRTVSALGTEQPENAVLIRQTPGTAFLRSDTLRDTEVIVLRYGERLLWWIDPATGNLLRFEGVDSGGTTPVVVDIVGLGRPTITGPAESEVLKVGTLGPRWLDWAPRSP